MDIVSKIIIAVIAGSILSISGLIFRRVSQRDIFKGVLKNVVAEHKIIISLLKNCGEKIPAYGTTTLVASYEYAPKLIAKTDMAHLIPASMISDIKDIKNLLARLENRIVNYKPYALINKELKARQESYIDTKQQLSYKLNKVINNAEDIMAVLDSWAYIFFIKRIKLQEAINE